MWTAINLALSVLSVLLSFVGIWLTYKATKTMMQARRVYRLSETLTVLWQIRQSVFACLAYTYALIRQPRLTELRGRALEELLLGFSNFAEQRERLGTRDADESIAEAIEGAKRALQSGAYLEAEVRLSKVAKILAEEVGKVRRALDEALGGEI